jgi:hypothetical protein
MFKNGFALWVFAFCGLGLGVALASRGEWSLVSQQVVANEPEPASNRAESSETDYITAAEVRKACKRLNIRDWSQLKGDQVEEAEARKILAALRADEKVDEKEFHRGLAVELEHGLKFKDANVTNNHPLVTGKIVLAHLKEFPEYYKRLAVLELEGDLHKALRTGNGASIPALCRRLVTAKLELAETEARQLEGAPRSK